ncbi:uncharacterized protein wu:fk95d07 isoform X2 [Chanodichthys erythropterus]|uniref:uncharacterized protein wu:fk95d07 isoform X2 n=1 Tax=Chanodichthys erythropterus TaxID=933992 RepID=UPI00351EFE1A
MKTVIIVLSVLGLCLSAPVEQDTGGDNGPLIGETDPITRHIFIPVPRADNVLTNPYFNCQYQYQQYQYPLYPSYPYYSLPPVVISLPQRNP